MVVVSTGVPAPALVEGPADLVVVVPVESVVPEVDAVADVLDVVELDEVVVELDEVVVELDVVVVELVVVELDVVVVDDSPTTDSTTSARVVDTCARVVDTSSTRSIGTSGICAEAPELTEPTIPIHSTTSPRPATLRISSIPSSKPDSDVRSARWLPIPGPWPEVPSRIYSSWLPLSLLWSSPETTKPKGWPPTP